MNVVENIKKVKFVYIIILISQLHSWAYGLHDKSLWVSIFSSDTSLCLKRGINVQCSI